MRRRSHWIRWFILGLTIVALFLVLRSCLAPSQAVPKVLFGLEEGTRIPVGAQSQFDPNQLNLEEQERRQILQVLEIQKQQPSATQLERLTTWINQYPDQTGLFIWLLQSELERPQVDDLKRSFVQAWSGHLDSLAQSLPKEPKLLYLQVLRAKILQKNAEWDSLSAALVKLSPQLGYARLQRGQALLAQCKSENARMEFKTALSLSSPKDRAEPYASLAQSYWGSPHADSGLLILDNALKIYPTDPSLLLALARWKESAGDLTAARTAYEKLSGLYPMDRTYKSYLSHVGQNPGLTCGEGSKTDKALKSEDMGALVVEMTGLTDKYPEDLGLRLALASALMQMGRPEDAKEQMAVVRRLDSSNLDVDSLSQKWASARSVANAPSALSTLSDRGVVKTSADRPEFGEYLVAWGRSVQEFSQTYALSGFEVQGNVLRHNFEDDQMRQHFTLDFTQGFNQVIGWVQAKAGMADLLGRVLRHKAQVSGQPTSTETVACGKLNFNTFLWENAEITELVFQDAKRTQSVGILRLSPKRIGPKTLCQLIQMVH